MKAKGANGMAQPMESTARNAGQKKAIVAIHTVSDAPIGDDKWKKEHLQRMKSGLTALEKKRKDLTPESAFKELTTALDLEIKRKKIDIEREELGVGY